MTADPWGVQVWDPAGDVALADALAPPWLACIEAGDDLAEEIDGCCSDLDPNRLVLSLTTAVACRRQAALPFAAAIGRRIDLSDELRERIATAVQEAAINAAVHGNLALGSELRDSLAGLEAFAAAVEERLADPTYAKRRVRLRASWTAARIIIDVHDDGVGYGVNEVPHEVQADAAKSGRGLAMLRSLSNGVSLGRQSRVVHLFFDREPAREAAASRQTRRPDAALLGAAILVLEDSATDRELIGRYLSVEGYWNLEFAMDGSEGLEKIARFKPDLIVLDILMPNVGGLEVCRRLRADAETRDVPVLVATAMEGPKAWHDIFTAGASDIVTKPVIRPELVARIRLHLERRLLARGAREQAEQMESDLRAASGMQAALIPSEQLQRQIALGAGLDVGSFVATSAEIGGDFWGICDLGGGRVGVYVVDFSGHGVAAAINAFRVHTLITEMRPLWAVPLELLAVLNARLRLLLPEGQFATMLYGIIDTGADEFLYCSAGAPPPIVQRGGSGSPRRLEASGVPLGIDAAARYRLYRQPFQAGARLFLHSDGLEDAIDAGGKRVGADALFAAIAAAQREATAQDAVNRVCRTMLGANGAQLADDVTALCIRRNGARRPARA